MNNTISRVSEQERSLWRVYLTLTKPKVVALMLLTALVGMCLAVPGALPIQEAILGLVGIAFMAGSAAAFNHLIDRRIDAIMARTYKRPLPSGELQTSNVFVFASGLGLVGFLVLYVGVNGLTAWLTFASLLGYAAIYTMYLKRETPQNIVIAGMAGAMPPLLGWTSVIGELHANAWLLVMIIFIWTPPHFWALAIHRKEDYAKAEIPYAASYSWGRIYKNLDFTVYDLAVCCLFITCAGRYGWRVLSSERNYSVCSIYVSCVEAKI